jgi:ABC-type polysaccharide/polyol phosphate export permease
MINAIGAAFIQQWKEVASSLMNIVYFIGAIPTAIVLAWVAKNSGNSEVLTYLLVGGPLINMWNSVIFRTGWSLSGEMSGRTLDFTLVSRTPLMLAMWGKSLAQLVYGIPTWITSLVTMLLFIRQMPSVADYPSLVVSVILIMVGLSVFSLFMSPLMVLVGGRAGFFNIFMGLGVMISGFMFPIDRLPYGLMVIARLLPTSWAMSGVWQSITGYDSYWSVLFAWGACLLTSVLILFFTYLMFRAVEKRIRVTGILGRY